MKALFFASTAALLVFSEPASADPLPLVEATFKLFNKDSTATCFLVHEPKAPEQPIIVTAAHVFEQMSGDTALLVLRKKAGDGSHERFDHSVKVRDGKRDLWTKHPDHDIAVLAFDPPADVPCPSLSTKMLLPGGDFASIGLTICGRAFLLTYPERLESNGAGFPVARGCTIASYPLGPLERHPSFLADFTAFGGDSGGPLFVLRKDGEPPVVIGIAIAQYRHDETIKLLNEERTRHHPLGLGQMLHAELILDTIRRAKEGTGESAD